MLGQHLKKKKEKKELKRKTKKELKRKTKKEKNKETIVIAHHYS